MISCNLIVILGPTASGKTKLAARVAAELHSEIISADSRQVYSGMNIGTGKDLEEYMINGKAIPFHLIDILEAGNDYNVYEYQKDFFRIYEEIVSRNNIPILCGGTGLYIDAVLKGYAHTAVPVDEKLREELNQKSKNKLLNVFSALPVTPYKEIADTSTVKRLVRAIEICMWEQTHTRKENETATQLRPVIFGLDAGRELRRKRIADRLDYRLKNGLIEEVKTLLANGVSEEKLIFYGLEYKFVVMYLNGELTFDEMRDHLTIAIQQFAKRQMTYFRKMEREGINIHWIDASLPTEKQAEELFSLLKIKRFSGTINHKS